MRPVRLSRLLFLRSLLVATLTFAVVYGLMELWLLPQIDRDSTLRQHQISHAVAAQIEAQVTRPEAAVRAISQVLVTGDPWSP